MTLFEFLFKKKHGTSKHHARGYIIKHGDGWYALDSFDYNSEERARNYHNASWWNKNKDAKVVFVHLGVIEETL